MNKKVYNANGMNLKLATVWRVKPIEAYESCQVRKEAAISGNFYVGYSRIRKYIIPIFITKKERIIYGIYSSL